MSSLQIRKLKHLQVKYLSKARELKEMKCKPLHFVPLIGE